MMSSRSLNYFTKVHPKFVADGVLPTLTQYFAALQVNFRRISVVCLTVEPGLDMVLLELPGSCIVPPGLRSDVHR